MEKKDRKFLEDLLEKSVSVCSRGTLIKLADYMVSTEQFIALKNKIESSNFELSIVISDLLTYWISYKSHDASLINFEHILRLHGLNAEAGEC